MCFSVQLALCFSVQLVLNKYLCQSLAGLDMYISGPLFSCSCLLLMCFVLELYCLTDNNRSQWHIRLIPVTTSVTEYDVIGC